MDIMRHKDAVDDIVKTGKALMNSKSADEKEILKVIFILYLELFRIYLDLHKLRDLLFGNSAQDSDSPGQVRCG